VPATRPHCAKVSGAIAVAQGVGLTTLDDASTLPEALRARTWKNFAAGAGIAVSNPCLGAFATGFRCEALDPLSTCQEDTVVAPFQLA
jgi:hypothetical protein